MEKEDKIAEYSKIFKIEELIIFIKSIIRVINLNDLKSGKNKDQKFKGVLTVVDAETSGILIKFHIGEVQKTTGWMSENRGTQLSIGYVDSGYINSFQIDQKGGAVVADRYVLSFSGLSSDFDNEIIVCLLAIKLKLFEFHEAAAIVNISNNEKYFAVLKEAINLRIVI